MGKIIIVTIMLMILSANSNSQESSFNNFYELVEYLYQTDSTLHVPDSLKSGSAKNVDRMKMIWGPRLSPHGDPSIAASAIINYSINYIPTSRNKSMCNTSANWKEEGPFGQVTTETDDGNGQINRITFDPQFNGTTNQTIYAGSFFGGLWRSIDNGENWNVVNTDLQLPQTSVADIAVSFQNSDYLFICTGEGDSKNYDKNNLSGIASPNFTTGIYRSTDYGDTWEAINNGFISNFTTGGTCRHMIVSHADDNNLFVATTNGLYSSTNALSTTPSWTKLNVTTTSIGSDDFKGLKMHPTNASIVYAASNDIYKTINGGNTWSSMTGSTTGLDIATLPYNFELKRINLEVSIADPDRLYAYLNGTDISENGVRYQVAYIFMYKDGLWQQLDYVNDKGDQYENLAVTWMGFAVSPDNPDRIYYGFTKVRGSLDIDTYPFIPQSGYSTPGFHADVHALAFQPNVSNPLLFCGNHGGVSRKNTALYNEVRGWKYKNNGFNVNLIWSFDISKVDPKIIAMGRQDCGSNILKKSGTNYIWDKIGFGDGYGIQIINDANTPQSIFLHSTVPNFYAPWDAATIANDPAQIGNSASREWIPKTFQVVDHPTLNKPIFGFSELYSYPDNQIIADQSATLTNNPWIIESDLYREYPWNGARRIREFDIAKSNPNYIYAASYGHDGYGYGTNLFRSTTGLKDGDYDEIYPGAPTQPAAKFQKISQNLPLFNVGGTNYPAFITGIAVSSKNPLHVWISVSGFNPNFRVFKTTDGGDTWINADPTNSLPELPANNIVYQSGTDDRLYLATDAGVYVTDNNLSCWSRFGNIPNTKVFELRINNCAKKLYAATYGRGIWSVDLLLSTGFDNELVINTNTIWNENIFLEQNLRIESGNKLTLKATLYMPADGNIIIEPGAILSVDNGTITNSCNKFWSGIQVWGNSNQDQYPLSQPTYQGKLELKNGALIEHARNAVMAWNPNDGYSTGSLIQASDATFKNCRRAVEFMSYPNFDNKSTFKRCKFIIDSDHPEIEYFHAHVTLWNTKGVTFSGCEFSDIRGHDQFSNFSGKGIFSIDAGYRVESDCSSPIGIPTGQPCPTEYYTRSTFANFNYGIHATGAGTNNTVQIDETDFQNNTYATYISALNNFGFTRNKVNIGGLLKQGYLDEYQYGLLAEEASGFTVEENTFEGTGAGIDEVGVNIRVTGPSANQIYRNTFKNNHTGQKFDGINRNPLASYEGLQFLCNSNIVPNEYDVKVTLLNMDNNSGIRTFQGSSNPDLAAGNTFSSGSFHIDNMTPNVIIYNYHDPAKEPLNITSGLVLTHQVNTANECPSNYWPFFPEFSILESASNSFYSDRANYDALLYNYFQTIDNGNTDSLVEAINMTWSSEAENLRNDLMSQAPYLSQEALWEAAGSGILTDAFLLEISLANVDATRDETYLDYIENEIPNPLPSNMVQLIYQNWSTETPRTLLEYELANLNAKMGITSNKLLTFWKTDSIDHTDSIENMYIQRKSLADKYSLIESALATGKFEEAYTILGNIMTNHELSDAALAEHNNLVTYVQFHETMSENKSILNLNENELVFLRALSESHTGRSSVMAQNILCFGYGECHVEQVYQLRRKNDRIYIMEASIETPVESIKVDISPNPVKSVISIKFSDFGEMDGILSLTNTLGQKIFEEKIKERHNSFNLSKLPNGTYLYQIMLNNKEIKSGKIIIQH